jgi:hypothetical protein
VNIRECPECELRRNGVLRGSLIQLRRASRHLLPSADERCAIWLMRGGSCGVIVGSRWVGCIAVTLTILPMLGASATHRARGLLAHHG